MLWEEVGDAFTNVTDAYIWVDREGFSQPADYVPGLGYYLVHEERGQSEYADGAVMAEAYATVDLLMGDD